MSSLQLEDSQIVGEVTMVSASTVEFKVSNSKSKKYATKYGSNSNSFDIGKYVVTENLRSLTLAQIYFVGSNVQSEDDSPYGTTVKCQILGSYSFINKSLERGVAEHPKIGQSVYYVNKDVAELFISKSKEKCADIGTLESLDGIELKIPFRDLYSRHCIVIGNTGGGKSWTLSRLIEENLKGGIKTILLDATGEFHRLPDEQTEHLVLTSENTSNEKGELVYFDYKNLTVEDLFAFFTPSQQAQASVLREAIKTLKMISSGVLVGNAKGGKNFEKTGSSRTAYETALAKAGSDIFSPFCNFDISSLKDQVEYECITNVWAPDKSLLNFNSTLLMRIESRLNAVEFACMFQPRGRSSVTQKIDDFQKDGTKTILRISLRDLPFEFYTREIVVNALTRFLMNKARKGSFKDRPTVLAVDEAHNFFKAKAQIGSEIISLNSLDIIAKEGRKFGLLLLIGTQRPKDIPSGAMSQIGAILCHRLTNEDDINLIKFNISEMNRSMLEKLPLLRQGEVLITNFKLPFPLVVSIRKPSYEPDSMDPEFN